MKLVASDLDGTVVRSDLTISPRTVRALAACREAGVEVVFVTGRPTRWMAPIAQATGLWGLAICGNGAVVYDLTREVMVQVHALAAAEVIATVTALRTVMDDVHFALESVRGFSREPGFVPRADVPGEVPVGTVEELLEREPPVLKVLCRSPHRTADAMLALARPVLAGVAEPVHSNAAGGLLEISALGVSKASTLALIAEQRGIAAEDVVAFGDMPNDVPMLRWAGRGYAMAGGHPEAIAAAGHLAPSCSEDGVAQVLEELLVSVGARDGGARDPRKGLR